MILSRFQEDFDSYVSAKYTDTRHNDHRQGFARQVNPVTLFWEFLRRSLLFKQKIPLSSYYQDAYLHNRPR